MMIALNFVVQEAAEVALPNARKQDVGIIAMKPMAGGHIEDANLAFKYYLQIIISMVFNKNYIYS